MKYQFYVDRKDARVCTLMLNVSFSGKRYRYSTGISLSPKFWDHVNQRIVSGDKNRIGNNKRLSVIAAEVDKAYFSMDIGANGKLVELASLSLFDKRIRAFLTHTEFKEAQSDLWHHLSQFIATYTKRTSGGQITNQRPDVNSLKRYELFSRVLREFSEANRFHVSFETINDEFYRLFVSWIQAERNLVDSTVGDYIKVLKTFMRWALDKGLHSNGAFVRFYKPVALGSHIALSARELRQIRDVDLSNNARLSRVRDHFLLQTYTALRYGDLKKLQPQHFDFELNVIRVPITKTDVRPTIPITAPLENVLLSYPTLLFNFYRDVKANVYLKELGLAAGLVAPTISSKTVNGKRIEQTVPKYKLLTTHVARRSFVTISIEFGLQDSVIRFVTGHKTNDVMQKHYARLSEEQIIRSVREAWSQL